MTHAKSFDLIVIGDRINPGFKPTRVLVDNHDIAGIQALAVRQVETGARYLDVTIGPRAVTDHAYLVETIQAIQQAVTVPLCYDYPDPVLLELCLKTNDRARCGGALPLINSITEQRWRIMDLYKPYGPFKVIVMTSERVEDGVAKANKTPEEFAATARRVALRIANACGLKMDDIFLDISVSAVVADTNGLHKATLAAIKAIRQDPELAGIHIMGGSPISASNCRPRRPTVPTLSSRSNAPSLRWLCRLALMPCWRRRGARSSHCRRTITCCRPTRIFWSRPAPTRCARCASSIGREICGHAGTRESPCPE